VGLGCEKDSSCGQVFEHWLLMLIVGPDA